MRGGSWMASRLRGSAARRAHLLLLQLPTNLMLITTFPTCTYRDRAITRSHTHTSGRGVELGQGGAGVPPPGVVLGVCVDCDAMAPSAQRATCHSPNECEGQHPTRTTTTLHSVPYHHPTLSKGVWGPSSTPHTL